MTFWIVALATGAILAFFFFKALTLRAPQIKDETDLAVYKQQLVEVDRDLERGIIAPDEADRLKTEISRRILALDKHSDDLASNLNGREIALIGAVFVTVFLGGGAALYTHLGQPGYSDLSQNDRIENAKVRMEARPSQTEVWDKMPAEIELNTPVGEMAEMVKQLRDKVATRPNDLEGHVLLFRIEAGLGNFRAAAVAKERVLSLTAEPTIEDYFDYAEMLILSVNGYVSPQAETALKAVLSRDPNHGPALYYSGHMMAQNDRPDVAFRLWNRLLRDGPDDAPWLEPIRAQIPELAFLAGISDFELPQPQLKGPSAEDIAAASDMTDGDRMDMIRGMVSQLSDRLATQGGSPSEWARLINALGVLGDVEQAKAIFANAKEVFASNMGALDQVTAAARQIGIAE